MQLDHVNIRTNDLEGTASFYRDVLGLELGPRPNFSFAGAWLYSEGLALVHLRAPNAEEGPGTGAVDHVAFRAPDLDEVVARLRARNIEHRLQALPDGSLRQCFLRDPNGVLIEVTGL